MSKPSATTPPSSGPIEPGARDAPVSGAPSDHTTVVELTAALRREGYVGSLTATDDGMVKCSACGDHTPPQSFDAQVQRRLEGASDPSDEMLLLAGPCAACRTRGVLLLGFGPGASAADTAVLEHLPIAGR